ncbi:helix-turn-helix domain-containing protein [Clostridium sp. HMP27]|uniref:helix-turn-helix domain-containing protein n=1 Tax=Clostridium sp. HMP27 TaxID=1487921 RepID=UPI00052CA9BB|nr:helix-turn-helix domain-containing protein [Clostridium sp. HMP27]KGK85990.1 hypothetical protein DP68_14230 [Clostridium sp. HMP27]
MEIITYIYSQDIKDTIKDCFNKKGIKNHDIYDIKDIICALKREKRTLLMIEIDNDNEELKNLLVKFKSINPLCEIVGLFYLEQHYLATEFVNLKLVSGIGFIPMNYKEFSKIINFFINSRKDITNTIIENISDKDYVIKDILSMEYIYDLIYGNIGRIKTLKETTKLMGLIKVPQLVLTLMCDDFWNICESLDNRERYNVKRKILNTVRNALKSKCRGVSATLIGTDKIVILLDCYPMKEKEAENFGFEVAEKIRKYINEKTIYTVTIGISSFSKDYRELWRAYEESFKALTHSFIRGDNSIIRYDEIKSKDNVSYERYLNEFEQKLIRCISSTSRDELETSFKSICKFLTISGYNPETIKSIIIKILFQVVQYCYNVGIDFKFLSKIMIDLMVEILKTNSFKSIEVIGSKFLKLISEKIRNLHHSDKSTVMNTAVAYINKYYYTNLTLEEVADVCNLSHFHFSRVFKNYCGVNFIQYLTNLRIEKAKQFLIESSATIEEISEKVGYKEVSYFSKTFKKIMEMSPSQYRKIK